MNKHNRMSRLLGRCVAGAFVFAAVAFGVCAQDTTTTTVRHGVKSYETEVKNAEVVYVEGNDLVLKLGSGKIEHLIVPDSDKFTINGSEVTVNELTPGTKLTQTITTTTAPRYVTTVRTLKGTVWHVNAHSSSVILRLPDGTNHLYRIPSHAKVMVAGKQKTVFDLKTGMKLEATIVTDDAHTVTERSKTIVGEAPPPPATPQEAGLLLFLGPRIHLTLPAPEVLLASSEQPASTLPKTGTLLPLAALLGGLAVATSLGLGAVRQALKA